ncbi:MULTISPECIES: histidine phosphatase family protein [Zhenhengia]|mgnify:FL=1|jgi:alpha-ribazole phosphatase|uniref:histidine phosphatase family protein n=1 Tax=Zhenhengia TaxID=2944196 RepID=UPI0015A96F89|nr:histidine phosphatase family protein [Zhenhengia yiwuensis]MBP3910234.1 histidine phosphatase family protein [Niameybacter sp.]MDU6359884.1 histidine phosphatase family protein [Clostridiales bacterium]MDY3368497.1 histidine phosphatase family protein [Zhenhengia yiwuensis]
MKIYWVRHGKTQQNEKNNYYGKLDVRLTPEGVREIKEIQTNFNDCINVYTSPAARAIETAGILFSNVYFKADARLLERNMGIFEGMNYGEIGKKYPHECKMWDENWQDYCIPEGESARMQYERVVSFIKELEALGEDAIVVCHAGTIRMAICYMLGGNLDMFWKFNVHTGTVVTTCYEHNYWYLDLSRENY